MATPHFAPATTFAANFGVKALVYGPPGRGKTPVCNSAPRPVLCASEPGLLSMRGSQVTTCQAFTVADIDNFYNWLWGSREADNFDTVCVDSVTQQAEIILTEQLKKNKDGRKAYGEMSRIMMGYMNGLYYTRNKHTYLICKQGYVEESGIKVRMPYFPGQDLLIKVPHLYDEILQLDQHTVPGVGAVNAFRCLPSYDARARDRSGRLSEFEEPDLTKLFNKILQG